MTRKVVIVNLQSTRFDKKADLVIHDYVDSVCERLCRHLQVEVGVANDLTDYPGDSIKPWI